MKKILTLFLCLIGYFSIAQDTTKVLFIGNSITYFNNMPQTFEAIANSKGDTTQVTVYAPGGTGFLNHVVNSQVFEKFREGIWDFVVLQPGSNESPGYSEPVANTKDRARILKDSILLYNPCAQILFYEISYGVWGNTPSQIDQYNTTMDLIRTNVSQWSDSTELFFAPAGEAVRRAWNNDPSVLLWGSTGDIHPNTKGSYIIACSFYASIFQKPSLGSGVFTSLTSQEAEMYQLLADTTVLNQKVDWRINTFNQFTDFTFTMNQLEIDFNSSSVNIDSLEWDFGDGTVSTMASEMHTYLSPNTYTVTLTTYRNGCIQKTTKEVDLLTASLNTLFNQPTIYLYPNPTNSTITIVGVEKGVSMNIYSIEGDLIQTTKELTVDISQFQEGIYFIRVEDKVLKWVKK